MTIKIGNCGWSYLNPEKYLPNWKENFKSKLQSYAKLFSLVEINSTFYRIPKLPTVEKWRRQVDEINPDFEFTIKCSKIITHIDKFSKRSFWAFEKMKEIARALRAKVLLFQSPASFKPTVDNLKEIRNFFKKIDREDFVIVWEVRWKDIWTKEIVKELFSELKINQCVDPFRQECFYCKDLVYYRLHGLGSPMYTYRYSENELKKLANKTKNMGVPTYILFNNSYCYENAIELMKLLKIKK